MRISHKKSSTRKILRRIAIFSRGDSKDKSKKKYNDYFFCFFPYSVKFLQNIKPN
jgi:hypothetical protein